MGENISVATVFYRYRPTADFYAFRFMLDQLLERGIVVHCVCSAEMRLKPHPNLTLHKVKVPAWTRRAWYARTLFELMSPLLLVNVVRKYNCRAIVTSKCEGTFLAAPARLLTRRPLVTYLEVAPWTIRRLSRKARIRRRIALWADIVGLCASTSVLAPNETVAGEIRRGIPFLAQRVRALNVRSLFPEAILRADSGGVRPESWREWLAGHTKRRREFTEKHQIPERWAVLSAPVELVERAHLETLLRAVSGLDTDRVALIFCGHNPEREFVEAMTVGLGLQDQVIFLESQIDLAEAFAASDMVVFPGVRAGASRAIASALGNGSAVFAADAPESREILVSEELLFKPAHVQVLLERIEQILEGKQKGEKIRSISRERALQTAGDWGQEFISALLL